MPKVFHKTKIDLSLLKNARALLFLILASMTAKAIGVAQGNLVIINKSFEDTPRKGVDFFSIAGWYDCGGLNFPEETPPDIHPGDYWSNNNPPSEGKTYLGLVVRDNNSYESISQRLTKSMESGKCYLFSIDLARSNKYMSIARLTNKELNYTTPAILRIWAGSGLCNEVELLGESTIINHEEWRTYQFRFSPKADYKFITIEAYWKQTTNAKYCGHILIDNLSDFEIMDCNRAMVSLVNKKDGQPIEDNKVELPLHKRGRIDKARTTGESVNETAKLKILEALDIEKIIVGSTIEVKNLYFKADTTSIDVSSYGVLDEIYDFLKTNRKVTIEIGGHTNGLPDHSYCDRLSKARSKAVYDYLVGRGIDVSRLTYKGYGKRKSLASDATEDGRLKNQRVEIKIIKLL